MSTRLSLSLLLAMFSVVSPEASAAPAHLDLGERVQPAPAQARLVDPGYHVWCGAPIKGHDGRYHLLYSRWPVASSFHPGWALHSEIAYAVSDSALGPYKPSGLALPARGVNPDTGKKFWDGDATHNPNILRHPNGKYYLFYMGNFGDGKDYAMHRNNQRIGVAVADHPAGPWKRFDQPIVDVSADPTAFDSLCVTNPAAAVRPDGGILLIYKAVEQRPGHVMGGKVRYGATIAERPEGPYKKVPGRIFERQKETSSEAWMLAEDPFIWFSRKYGNRYHAVARDVVGSFTGEEGAIALFESDDGLNWRPSRSPKVLAARYRLEDGTLSAKKLERPAVLLEYGEPIALFGGADGYVSGGRASANVAIPLKVRLTPDEESIPDISKWIQPIRAESVFSDPEYNIWCGSVVESDDGKFHMFYSRWPRSEGHNAWVTHSEVARAVSDSPYGPFVHQEVVLPQRAKTFWDGACTHNPTVVRIGDRYYLYYMGNTGDREKTNGLNWQHRNNQRIGVAYADKPEGPWVRFATPLIDVRPDPENPDALATNNPSVVQRPDGTVLMVYKAVGRKGPLPFGGPVVHLAATAPTPLGPFQRHPTPLFTREGLFFAAEDPFVWHDGTHYLAIVKDMDGSFTDVRHSLALFYSKDGVSDWKPAPKPFVAALRVTKPDGSNWFFHKLERPQLLLKSGKPVALYCAASDTPGLYGSVNIAIPLSP